MDKMLYMYLYFGNIICKLKLNEAVLKA